MSRLWDTVLSLGYRGTINCPSPHYILKLCVCVRVCVRKCVRKCVRSCLLACVLRVCVRPRGVRSRSLACALRFNIVQQVGHTLFIHERCTLPSVRSQDTLPEYRSRACNKDHGQFLSDRPLGDRTRSC